MKSSELVITSAKSELENIVATRCRYSEVALVIDPKTTFDEWQQIYGVHKHLRDKANWFLGDCVNYGDRMFGEKYAQAIHETGKSYRTLVEIASVCERITPDRRQPGLSWSHHKAIAYIDDHRKQDQLLREAAEHDWTVQELTQHAKPAKAPEAPQIDREPNPPQHTDPQPEAAQPNRSERCAPEKQPKEPDPKSKWNEPDGAVQTDAEVRLEDFVLSIRSLDVKAMKPLLRKKWLNRLEPIAKFIEELRS